MSNTRLNGRPDLPKLLTARQFGAKIGRAMVWVQTACKEGRIPAAQIVGRQWVIPEDALIRPRYLTGISNRALDIGLPPEFVFKSPPIYVEEPEYVPMDFGQKGPDQPNKRLIQLPSLERIRLEKNLSRHKLWRMSRVKRESIKRAEEGLPVKVITAHKLARALEVDIETLMDRSYRGGREG